MQLWCAWCVPPKYLGEKEPMDDDNVSHTICESCLKEAEKEGI